MENIVIGLFKFDVCSEEKSLFFPSLTEALNGILKSNDRTLKTMDQKEKAINCILHKVHKKHGELIIETRIFPVMMPGPESFRCSSILINIYEKKSLLYSYDARQPGKGMTKKMDFASSCSYSENSSSGPACDMTKLNDSYIVSTSFCNQRRIYTFAVNFNCGCSCGKKSKSKCKSKCKDKAKCKSKCKDKAKAKCKDGSCFSSSASCSGSCESCDSRSDSCDSCSDSSSSSSSTDCRCDKRKCCKRFCVPKLKCNPYKPCLTIPECPPCVIPAPIGPGCTPPVRKL